MGPRDGGAKVVSAKPHVPADVKHAESIIDVWIYFRAMQEESQSRNAGSIDRKQESQT